MENWLVGLIAAAGISLAAYLVESGARVLRAELKKRTAEAEEAERHVLAAAFEGADKVLEKVTRATVGKLEGSVAAELREKVKNGEAEYEDLCRVSEAACREIIGQLKPELQTVLLECIGDMEGYIKNRIENVLPEVKADYARITAGGAAGCADRGDTSDGTVAAQA